MQIEAISNEFNKLLSTLKHLSEEDRKRLDSAYNYATEKHQDQMRRSGEPYISHPVRVAAILADYSPDFDTVAAALLHDVLEDTDCQHSELTNLFGKSVADIVEGVSKLKFYKGTKYEAKQAENFQKMALAMAKDLRVIFVKLADRLHNMRTIHYMDPAKAKNIARETIHVYAPLAQRLGISSIFTELEDLSFKTIYPMRYNMISKAVEQRRLKNIDHIKETKTMIMRTLKKNGITGKVEGREKHYAGIYYKMASGLKDPTDSYYQDQHRRRRSSFNDIMDIHGFRIILSKLENCYLAMCYVHQLFNPMPGRFKDYIAVPKSNGYQSLHTTVLGLNNYPIEIQIRTQLMHEMSEKGIAAHLRYKKSKDKSTPNLDRWLSEIPAWTDAANNAEDFSRHMRLDLHPTEVYVFSRDGDIVALPRGSTPVDFAYAIHTQVGNKCTGCTINDKDAPLSTRLENGQRVNIITDAKQQPDVSWRNFVVSGRALSALGVFQRQQKQTERIRLGRQLLAEELHKRDKNINTLDNAKFHDYLNRSQQPHFEHVLEHIGMGKIIARNVADGLLQQTYSNDSARTEINISKDNANALTFAKCCRPVYGDNVIAMIRTDSGIVIHRRSCTNIRKLLNDPERTAYAYWEEDSDVPLPVSIRMETNNERILIAAIANTITLLDGNILTFDVTERDATAQVLTFEVFVKSRFHLSRLLRKLRQLADVQHVKRGR